MKFSESWLREYVEFDVDSKLFLTQLTMAGLEVDGVQPAAEPFSGVIVAAVTATKKHPTASHLKVCDIDTGKETIVQVVCGAPNVRIGQKVAMAMVGARLPGDLGIERGDIRGVESSGMLCSSAELGISEDRSGILELPGESIVGSELRQYLDLDDRIIDLDLTPNRGDCLSIRGLARETAVLHGTACTFPENGKVEASATITVPVSLTAPEACPRYAGRVITGINPGRKSPLWLTEKLRRSGLRSVDAIVDVANFVMLELGQPLHAFDYDVLQGGIEVRFAREGESLTLLGGNEIQLDSNSLVISDQSGPLALAGVMGGLGSAVTHSTRNVFLESAYFNPLIIAGRARQYALHTDASHRFERGVDPVLAAQAIERATELLLEIVGGEAGPTVVTENQTMLPRIQDILLRKHRVEQQLQVVLSDDQIVAILSRLGIKVRRVVDEGWLFSVPTWRFDLLIEADLIEEIARIHGYEKIPSNAVSMPLRAELIPERFTPLKKIKQLMISRDYFEAITYSFVDENLQKLISPHLAYVALSNPISADMGVMRSSLVSGLLMAVKYNLNRQQERIRLFETGQCFVASTPLVQEERLAAVIVGNRFPENWAETTVGVDFYDIKGDVEAILSFSGASNKINFRAGEHPILQNGQALLILDKEANIIGYAGKLNPVISNKLDLIEHIFLFEIKLAAVTEGNLPKFSEISRFPGVKRDIALIIDKDIAFSQLESTIQRNAGKSLNQLKVFDIYEGKHIESNRKSIGISLTFQNKSRTLSDQEVQAMMDKILTALENQHSARLRG